VILVAPFGGTVAQFYILKTHPNMLRPIAPTSCMTLRVKERDELNLNDQRVADTRHFRAGHPKKSINRIFGSIIFNFQLHTVKKTEVFSTWQLLRHEKRLR